MPKQRIAVIGGVASGPAAAAQAKRSDPQAEVVLFERGREISYGACEIPYYIADWIAQEEQLITLTPEAFEQSRGAQVCIQHEVVSIRPRACRLDVKALETGDVREERFDKFILAVGARARMPGLPGEDAPNVFPLRQLEDATRLKRYIQTHRIHHGVILGGGYVGVEVAEALREGGIRVTILDPADGLLSAQLESEFQAIVHNVLRRHQVVIRQEVATAFECSNTGLVTAVITNKGEKIGCQLVIAAMGITPNVELAEQAGVSRGSTGALAVDEQMRTNLPNVWACGDCIEVSRVVDGKKVYVPLSTVAFRTARVAAYNAARRGQGPPARFPGVSSASAVKVFDLEVASLGLKLQEALDAGFDAYATSVSHRSRSSSYPGSKPLHVRLIAEKARGRLLGASFIGEDGAALRANVLVPCIREQWTVHQIRDLDLIYTPPFAPALDPIYIAANEATKQLHRTFKR